MNLLDFRTTSIRTVFDEVARRAGEKGVEVDHSELVGLAPAAALDGGFDSKQQIVEKRLKAAGM